MPQGSNVVSMDTYRESRDATPLYDATELHFREANPELSSFEEARARREALAAAAFIKTPIENERLAEVAVEGIVRSGAWIEYVRKDYLGRHWNLHERDQPDDYLKAA